LNKKPYISFLLLLAFSVLFMHSVIPHHHDEDQVVHHSGGHDDDHEDMDHNLLSHAFGSFHHEQGGTVYESASPTVQYCKVNFTKEVAATILYLVSDIEKPPLIHSERYLSCFVKSPYLGNKAFRGPPSFMA
jgi:hypothetical protein